MNNDHKVWLITGASSGLGKALAEAAIANGDRVVVTARRLDRLRALAKGQEDRVLPLAVDVTDAAARDKAVADTLARFGRIDVLANLAGRGVAGACEEFSLEQLREQMELNFFAAAEMTRAVLPQMRRQGSGNVITVSSIAGLVAMNAAGPYCAAKFALEGWTESLAIEAYRPSIAPFETYLAQSAGRQMGDPAKAAQRMLELVTLTAPPVRLMLGRDAYAMWDTTLAKRQQELNAWRERGEDTAFDGAELTEIQL
ncbi:SDR family NAD(P)-dependent oxidoreductase [Serratia marcescens]|uniref:SDR family NAD(P)-dependent oxidoreductase n=1 Tax=Serratia marcescens TaxID=615 RepID=UPI003FA688AF